MLVVALLAFWMFGIAARLVYLQAAQHAWLSARAQSQQQDSVATSALRGVILDRKGRELARSTDAESFFVVPGEIQDIEAAARLLGPKVGVDSQTLAARIAEARSARRKFMWVARKIDAADAEGIRAQSIHGLYSIKEPKRYYPNGLLAAHVLGFVDRDEMGLAGVEQAYNEHIKGEPGSVLIETDALRRPYASSEVTAKPGQSVVLTIDQMIQYRTETALRSAVERTRAKSGSAIVLDPRTGEVLALANAPAFDPNRANTARPQERVNGALQNIYEPGSTFKVVAYSAAIEKGLVKPDDLIDCQMGSIMVAGRLVHDHHPFGTLTIADALAKSSNVAAIKLGLRVGNGGMADLMARFGFGAHTGIELRGESPGIVRPVGKWQPSSMGSIAMGQEVGVTPLQMVAAYGAIANNGVRVAPHLIKEIRAQDGSVVYRAEADERRVVSANTARAIRGMLEGVTLNGTAKRAQLDGYSAAGKTGTAQKIDPKTHAYSATKFIGSFVGFAPVDDPTVVIIVVIDEPVGSYHGGDVAAPVFREIAEQILPELNVAPDVEPSSPPPLVARATVDPDAAAREQERLRQLEEQREATLPVVESVREGGRAREVVYAAAGFGGVLMPDLRGKSVHDAATVCSRVGVQLEAHGEGRASRQTPEPGTELSPGQIVKVEFSGSD